MRPGPIIYGPLGEQVSDLRGSLLDDNETMANARLIACAPEMLEALTRLLNEIESICAHEAGATRDELLERLHMDWDGKLRAARAIISKAKG